MTSPPSKNKKKKNKKKKKGNDEAGAQEEGEELGESEAPENLTTKNELEEEKGPAADIDGSTMPEEAKEKSHEVEPEQ